MERIRTSAGELPEQDEIRPRLKNLLGQFNVRGPQEEDFALAKTAMVYWIDELLVNSEWVFAGEWRDNPLEREIYGSRNRAWKFFENADFARSLERTDALETFGQCVALGFQGIYRSESLRRAAAVSEHAAQETEETADESDSADETGNAKSTHGATVEHLNGEPHSNGATSATAVLNPTRKPTARNLNSGHLPQTLSEWAAPVFSQLRGDGREPYKPISPIETPRDARPLSGKQQFLRWTAVLAVTTVVSLLILAARG